MLTLLEIRDLEVFNGNVKALDRLSLRVTQGELIVVLGANGAGKTTLLRTISGLQRAQGGSIEYRGEDISRSDANYIVRKGVSQCPEGRKIFPKMTVMKNMRLGAYIRKDVQNIRSDMEKMYELFPRLKERRMQLAGQLSGGEQQMLALARALMSQPNLLLLDEPSMGLSPIMFKKMTEYIQEINKLGITILLVEQNAKASLCIGTRGYVIERGKVAIEGSCKQLSESKEVLDAYLGG